MFNFKNVNVLIVGDIVLDRYYFGSVDRISPEAPVPVVKVNRVKDGLGGAANVANNIAHLKAHCSLIGYMGQDNEGSIIESLASSVNFSLKTVLSDFPTISKVRVLGQTQQICRIDFEEDAKEYPHLEDKVIENINSSIEDSSSVVISDYGKGVCSDNVCKYIIEKANKLNIPICVDPKGTDWDKYKNATLISPNVKELALVYDKKIENTDKEIELVGKIIREKYSLKYLLVTRSEKGMSLIAEDYVQHFPTLAKDVFDVSGAGDTVVSIMALKLGDKSDIIESVELANKAAGIVVSKIGTVPITRRELKDSFSYSSLRDRNIINAKKAKYIVQKAQSKGKKVVFTNGVFDILHKGHISYLEETSNLGDVLIVGLNSDSSTKRLKGDERPINKEKDRATVLLGLNSVDYVVIFDEDTPYELLSSLKPDILAKGGDYRIEEIIGREFAKETFCIDFVDGYSTTKTISNINSNKEK